MIRAIFFDLDNTLVDRQAAYERYLDELGGRFPALREAAARRLLRVLDEEGLAPRHRYCAAVVVSFPELHMTVDEYWDDFGDGLVRAIQPEPRVAELLERVARRYRLVVVTNGSGARQRAKVSRAGLDHLLQDLFISEEVGARKPDPRLFGHALSRTGFSPAEVLFVGDDPRRDIEGAHAAGMTTCWISRGRPYPAGPPRPGLSVARVEDLLEALAEGAGPPCAT